jgi:hypothetical protein
MALNHDHIPAFHNDGKEDWCNICKLNAEGNEPQYLLDHEIKNFLESTTIKQRKDLASTPDSIQAEMLLGVMKLFHTAVEQRMEWKGETKEALDKAKEERIKRRRVALEKTIRQTLPLYGSEDHGSYPRQTQVILDKVMESLEQLEYDELA